MSKSRKTIHILVICGQSLTNIKGATRAFNMYRALENEGLRVTYLDGWKVSYKLNRKNVINWIKLISFALYKRKNKYIFIENVIHNLYIKIISKLGLPIVIDVRDDRNLHAESMGIQLPEEIVQRREIDMQLNFERAHKILLTSESYNKYYSEKYKEKFDKKFIIVMNATNPNHFKSSDRTVEYKIGYLGGVNKDTGLELLLEAALIVKNSIPKLEVHIGYDTLQRTGKYIKAIKNKYSYDWIYYYDSIFYNSAPKFYSNLDIIAITRLKSKINEMSTPSKLFDTMASSRPLVVTNLREQSRIITIEKCGLVCDFTPVSISRSIIKLLRDYKFADELGRNGRIAVEERHNWKNRVNTIIENLINC